MYIFSCTLSLAHSDFPAVGTLFFHSRVPMTLPFFGYSNFYSLSRARARCLSRSLSPSVALYTCTNAHLSYLYSHVSFSLSLRIELHNIYTYPLSRAHSFSRLVSFSPFLCLSLFASHCTTYTYTLSPARTLPCAHFPFLPQTQKKKRNLFFHLISERKGCLKEGETKPSFGFFKILLQFHHFFFFVTSLLPFEVLVPFGSATSAQTSM